MFAKWDKAAVRFKLAYFCVGPKAVIRKLRLVGSNGGTKLSFKLYKSTSSVGQFGYEGSSTAIESSLPTHRHAYL